MPRDSLPITHKLLTSLLNVGIIRASKSGTPCSPALAAIALDRIRMKYNILLFFLGLLTISCQRTRPMNDAEANRILKESLKDTTDVLSNTKILIDDEETAIKFAEVILFKVYGQGTIQREKPYNIKNIDGYWIINGTVHAQFGGAFEIVFSSRDGQIIRSTHYN